MLLVLANRRCDFRTIKLVCGLCKFVLERNEQNEIESLCCVINCADCS